jgi:hypothetical protein
MIKKLLEERKYLKKYNAFKLVFAELVDEYNALELENERLEHDNRELKRERRVMCGGINGKELSNDKGSTSNSRNRVSVSKQDNEKGSRTSTRKKLSTTTN